MKAFYQTSYKKTDYVNYSELPDPVTAENQLLVSVKAASINPVDYKIRNGSLKFIVGSKFPKILGSDFAGTVKEAGTGVGGFKPGDKVYGAVSAFSGKPGSLAELVTVDQKSVRHIPEGISFEEAASLPVAALTALNGLRRCGLKKGSNVLVNGATGGVGHFAVQIAKAYGATVTATCSVGNSELARQLGADKIIGYRREDFASIRNEYDVILDAFGKMNYTDVYRMLRKGGSYASTMFFLPTSYITAFFGNIFTGKKLTSANMRSLPGDYEEIEKLIVEKKLKPVIENRFPLNKADEAFNMAEVGKPRGKVIVNV